MAESRPFVTQIPFQIRRATAHDRTAILALMRPRDYNRINLQPRCFFVATVADMAERTDATAVIGIGQVKRHWDGTPELASLVVAPRFRHQGVGSALVKALVAHHFADTARLANQESAQTAQTGTQPSQPLYLFCLSTLESYYRQFGFFPVARHTLPWPLYTMHLLGNGMGRFVQAIGGAEFHVIAMRVDTTCT